MNRIAVLLCAASLTLPGLALAQQQPSERPKVERDLKADGSEAAVLMPRSQKRVCKSVTYTGSRLGGQRVCKSQQEWDEISARARDATTMGVNKSFTSNCVPGQVCS